MRPKRQYSENCGSLSEAAAIEVPRAKAALASAEIPDGYRWDAPPKARFAPDSPLEEDGFEPSVPLGKRGPRIWLSCYGAEPKVRIHFPPAVSLLRKPISDGDATEPPLKPAGGLINGEIAPLEREFPVGLRSEGWEPGFLRGVPAG